HVRYLHLRGGQSRKHIAKAKGIPVAEEQKVNIFQPKFCPNPTCKKPYTPPARSCIHCLWPLSPEGYQQMKEDQIKKDARIKTLEEKVNSMGSSVEELLEILRLVKKNDGRPVDGYRMLDEKRRVTIEHVGNDSITEVKIPIDDLKIDKIPIDEQT
ncbi:MAG: hypothetical protein WA364_02715, partial [Candidatus Nitrosopolaris sp.]